MFDTIEKIGSARVQHGENNKRIFLTDVGQEDLDTLIHTVETIAKNNLYEKIVGRVPEWGLEPFLERGYRVEAKIPNMFKGDTSGFFVANYINRERASCCQKEMTIIESVKSIAYASTKSNETSIALPSEFKLKKLETKDMETLVKLHTKAFKSYPFPIFDKAYLLDCLEKKIEFFGLYDKENLVISTAIKLNEEDGNIEIIDFATHPDYRGQNLYYYLVEAIKIKAKKNKYRSIFSTVRSKSYGLNITFCQQGFHCGGTLINQTRVLSEIESMNVWYLHL